MNILSRWFKAAPHKGGSARFSVSRTVAYDNTENSQNHADYLHFVGLSFNTNFRAWRIGSALWTIAMTRSVPSRSSQKRCRQTAESKCSRMLEDKIRYFRAVGCMLFMPKEQLEEKIREAEQRSER